MRPPLLTLALSLALGLAVWGCGGSVGVDGSTVGGPCTTNTDCSSSSRCLTSGDFPGGYCTVNCAKHEDCPTDARCIEKESGVCLQQCELPQDCRGGYTCKGKKNQFGGGESLVCIKD
ncbi:MAG: hypothetical protein IT384_22925 [Deltaproteobacteria bacterium]|nr:hypothetical protein [Deltaproteobacteria bacterium]